MPGTLMSDAEIREALRDGSLQATGLTLYGDKDRDFARGAPIQPSSLDLHIGRIFVPPETPGSGRAPRGDRGYRIPPGRSVVVETREHIALGPTVAGFGFPPAALASQGILMTNPGHVDPGYEGTLSFTLINMGRDPHPVNADDVIVSLLLFRFDEGVARDYRTRRDDQPAAPPDFATMLDHLSPDFGSFHQRMDAAAKAAIDDRVGRIEIARLYLPALAGAATALVIWFSGLITNIDAVVVEDEIQPLRAEVAALRREVDRLTATGDALQLDDRLDALQRQLDSIAAEEP